MKRNKRIKSSSRKRAIRFIKKDISSNNKIALFLLKESIDELINLRDNTLTR